MSGLRMTLAPFKNQVVCHGGITAHGARAYAASLAHVG